MIDFAELSKYFVLVVVVACLIVGYILKTSFESFPNKYIPNSISIRWISAKPSSERFNNRKCGVWCIDGISIYWYAPSFYKICRRRY